MIIIPRLKKFNPNFYYLLNQDIDYSILVVHNSKKYLFTSLMNIEYAKKIFGINIKIYDISKFHDFVIKKNPRIIHLDYDSTPIKLYEKLSFKFKVKPYLGILNRRIKKTEGEKKKIRKAVYITKKILDGLEIKEGMREKDIEKEIKLKLIENEVEFSFPPIIASLKNARFPHYKTGMSRIKKGVLIDIGIKYDNYCSDISRVIFLRKNKDTEKERSYYEKLKDVFYEIVDNFNFEKAKDLASFSFDLFKKYGLKKLPHLIGHGIGLEVHERPILSEKSEDSLINSVLAIEPAFYSSFGLRFEEDILVNKNKVEIL